MEKPRWSLSSQAFQTPTIFLEANPNTFRYLVQKYTGAPMVPSFAQATIGPRCSTFKLQERRPSMSKLFVDVQCPQYYHHQYPSPRSPKLPISPGWNHPSPMTPLDASAIFSPTKMTDEERVIADKGFYLHPSPQWVETPKLLQLFPLTSAKLSPKASSDDDGASKVERD